MRLFNFLPRAPLVLLELKTEAGARFLLRARPSGIVAFLATLLKIGTATEVTISETQAEQTSADIFGESHVVLPLGAIESFAAGFRRRPLWLALMVVFPCGVLATGFPWWVGLAAALLCLFKFALSKRLEVALLSGSGMISVRLRPSATGLRVDLGILQRIARSIGERIAEHAARRRSSAIGAGPA